MAVRAPRSIGVAGSAPVEYAATAGGDTITNNKVGKLMLTVRNGSGAPVNVTVSAVKACNHGTLHNLVVAVPAGASRQIGPLDSKRFGSAVGVAYSASANVFIDPQLIPGS